MNLDSFTHLTFTKRKRFTIIARTSSKLLSNQNTQIEPVLNLQKINYLITYILNANINFNAKWNRITLSNLLFFENTILGT